MTTNARAERCRHPNEMPIILLLPISTSGLSKLRENSLKETNVSHNDQTHQSRYLVRVIGNFTERTISIIIKMSISILPNVIQYYYRSHLRSDIIEVVNKATLLVLGTIFILPKCINLLNRDMNLFETVLYSLSSSRSAWLLFIITPLHIPTGLPPCDSQ